jgi:hypothetical protein
MPTAHEAALVKCGKNTGDRGIHKTDARASYDESRGTRNQEALCWRGPGASLLHWTGQTGPHFAMVKAGPTKQTRRRGYNLQFQNSR